MSEETVESALAMAEAFNRRDFDALAALADDDIKVESRLVAMEGAYGGHDGLRRGGTTSSASFPTTRSRSRSCVIGGDVTLAHIRSQ